MRTSARARSAGGKSSSDSALSSLLGPTRPRGTLPLSKTPPALPLRSLAVLWAEACSHAESCSRFISSDFDFPSLQVLNDQTPNLKTHPNSLPKWSGSGFSARHRPEVSSQTLSLPVPTTRDRHLHNWQTHCLLMPPHCSLHAAVAKHKAVAASADGPNQCHLVPSENLCAISRVRYCLPTSWPSC